MLVPITWFNSGKIQSTNARDASTSTWSVQARAFMLSASHRALLIRSSSFAQRNTLLRSGRGFVLTANSQHTLSLHPTDVANPEDSTIARADPSSSRRNNYMSVTRRQKYNDLMDSLNAKNANPNWTWTCYVDLLDSTRDEPLPLEIHQRVLRSCTQEPRAIRNAFVRRLRERRRVLDNPHRHEGRFLTVITNIRRAGYAPTLDDYEFILGHFAAVGHYIGAAQVLQEIIKADLEARTRTFGLCLQAIAYRLSLPCRVSETPKLREQCSQLCLHIASLIRKRKRRVPSACLDLILRIMKNTDNTDVFKSLLKMAYGIDLDYLDRHPITLDNAFGDPEPFSTAALTTLVDFLGRQKQTSRMVAAFEVLSTPLFVSPSEIHLRNFDDDEDDWPMPADAPKPRPLPSAQPNTTTYNTLIRHCAHLQKPALAKHYVLQALELDYSASVRLRSEVQSLPLANVHLPKLRVTTDTFLSVLGLINRTCNLGLMKWLLPHFRNSLRRKKEDLHFYAPILRHTDGGIPEPSDEIRPGGLLTEYGFAKQVSANPAQLQNASEEAAQNANIESSVTFFTPSSRSTTSHMVPASSDERPIQGRLDSTLEPTPPSADTPLKQFDLATHVQVLERDIQAMRDLDSRIGRAIVRLHIRRKEALGRRIWAGKNIYLRHVNNRIQVTREDWMEIVNFGGSKPRRSFTDTSGTATTQDSSSASS